ncbi:MAG: helix-turn-helix transcriptional regulator [Anaerolineales bacterium]|nr:helix-turn-helix transcriptional regulator [Anaerolineales bacterium]
MNTKKRQRLSQAGWKVEEAVEFLELTPEEAALMEIKAALSQDLQRRRQASHMTQVELARRLGSSQSRVAYAERGARSVSMDLLLQAAGVSPKDIGRTIAAGAVKPRRTMSNSCLTLTWRATPNLLGCPAREMG